jgi:hypothetical protein
VVTRSLGHPRSQLRVGIAELCRNRAWPMAVAGLSVVAGMAVLLEWEQLLHHADQWSTSTDLWGIFRAAHYVGWGDLGGIYAPGNGVDSLPGMAVLLSPVAMLSSALHLSEEFPPFVIARPTAALLLQPIEVLLASSVVFATDALAERLQVSRRRRAWVAVAVGLIAFPVGALWGHAEDALAMTFAVYALVAMLDRRWARCGWLLGFGIVFQPLVAVILPLVIGASPAGRRGMQVVRPTLLPVALVALAFLGNAAGTYRAVVEQPTPPAPNHATPWLSLAPRLPPETPQTGHTVTVASSTGHLALKPVTSGSQHVVYVTGGAGRGIYVVLAALLGLFVWRRPQPGVRLVWLAALLLAARCFFEAVMTPYYVAPALLLALVLAASRGSRRFAAASALAVAMSVFAYFRLEAWLYWLPIVASMSAMLVLSYPAEQVHPPDECGSTDVADDRSRAQATTRSEPVYSVL